MAIVQLSISLTIQLRNGACQEKPERYHLTYLGEGCIPQCAHHTKKRKNTASDEARLSAQKKQKTLGQHPLAEAPSF
jgi:hypothetical protein